MAAVTISKVSIPHTNAGYNLTDSTAFTTLTTGAGNGVQYAWSNSDILALKNDSGGPAVFTIKLGAFPSITEVGGSVTNPSNTVADGKIEIMRLDSQFANTSGNVVIECDVVGKVLVLTP